MAETNYKKATAGELKKMVRTFSEDDTTPVFIRIGETVTELRMLSLIADVDDRDNKRIELSDAE